MDGLSQVRGLRLRRVPVRGSHTSKEDTTSTPNLLGQDVTTRTSDQRSQTATTDDVVSKIVVVPGGSWSPRTVLVERMSTLSTSDGSRNSQVIRSYCSTEVHGDRVGTRVLGGVDEQLTTNVYPILDDVDVVSKESLHSRTVGIRTIHKHIDGAKVENVASNSALEVDGSVATSTKDILHVLEVGSRSPRFSARGSHVVVVVGCTSETLLVFSLTGTLLISSCLDQLLRVGTHKVKRGDREYATNQHTQLI